MVDYTEGIGDAIREGFCTIAPAAAVGALVFGGIATLGVADVVAGVAAGAVGLHAYNRYCNQPLPDEGRPSSPFTGGQCPVQYDVSVRITRASGTIQNPFDVGTVRVLGPVQGATFVNLPGNSTRIDVIAAPSTGHTDGRYAVGSVATNFGGGENVNSATITSVVRVDGNPDNCGSPTPVIPTLPPGGNIVNSPVTYINNEGDTVNIPLVIAFGYADIDFNGTVNIPIKLNFTANPELNLNGTLNLNTGDTTFYPNPGTPRGNCNDTPGDFIPDPTIPDAPDSGEPIDPYEPTLPEDSETRKILRGVVVTVTSEGRTSGFISQESNPDVWFPDLGFVQFAVQIGNSIAWLRHEKVNSLRHLIQCDWPAGAVAVRGTPRAGVTWTLTPVYTKQTYNRQFPPE